MPSARPSTAADRADGRGAVREGEDRYRSLAENFPSGALFIIDRNWTYVAADGQALTTVGLRSEDVVGRTVEDVFPELWELVRSPLVRAFGGEEVRYELTYRDRYYANDAIPLRDDRGEAHQVIVVARDMTESKRAEEALRASEERFRLLLDDIDSVAIQGYDAEGIVRYWNEGSKRLYGYALDEALGRNLLELVIPPESREEVRARIDAMVRTGEAEPSGELDMMRKDGSRVEVYSSHSVLERPGHPVELFCIDVDLTEINRAKREQVLLKEQLLQAQKLESVGRLAGGVAHDFNNMLNVILGHAELLLDDAQLGAEAREDLQEIRRAARRSADLTRQLLAFARRQAVQPKVLDINEAITPMLKMLKRLIGEDIELSWQPGTGTPPIRIDPAQLDQLLANLVVNARDAIRPGGGRVSIATAEVELGPRDEGAATERGGGRFVSLSVADDGRGMDEAERALIFEPFFTTKGPGDGTGLGLATVYGIVKQNQGFIEVETAPGRGSRFSLLFPAQPFERKEALRDRPSHTPRSGRGETILVAEDEAAILGLCQQILTGLGYRVLVARSPQYALELADEVDEVRLLLTDVVMPDMTGYALAARLRARFPGLRCLFMSGYPDPSPTRESDIVPVPAAFIHKPFSRQELAVRVREALDGVEAPATLG